MWAAHGVKICAKDLEKAIAGLNCLVAYHPDEVSYLFSQVALDLPLMLKLMQKQCGFRFKTRLWDLGRMLWRLSGVLKPTNIPQRRRR